MNKSPFERRTHGSAPDAVLIGLCHSVVARVKTTHGLDCIENPDAFGQQAVHGLLQILNGNRVYQVEGRALGQCVNPRVGAPRTGHMDRRSFYLRQHALDFALNGSQMGLNLPPVKVRSVVADRRPYPPRVARKQAINIPLKIQGTIALSAFV